MLQGRNSDPCFPISSPQGSFASTIPLGYAQENRCGAPASETLSGKTRIQAFPHEYQRQQEGFIARSQKGLCFLRRHASFRIDDNIQIAFRCCYVPAARKLERNAALPGPTEERFPSSVL